MKRTLVGLMIGLSFVGASSVTKAASDLSQCIKIESPLDRLSCYDEKSGRTPKAEMNKSGKWKVSVETSKMKDTTDITIIQSSENNVQCNYGGNKINLYIRCKENAVDVLFYGGGCFFTETSAEFRLDKEQTYKEDMVVSTNNKALFIRNPKSFIKKMFDKNQLYWRVSPYNESPILAEFDITGLKDVIAKHDDTCLWTYR